MARRVMDEAAEFDLKEGFALSLRTLDEQVVLFSAGGRHIEMGPDTQGHVDAIANYAIGRAIMLKQEAASNKPIMLSVTGARGFAMGGRRKKRLGNWRGHEDFRARRR